MVSVWRRLSKSTVFALLMIAALLGALAPAHWTSWVGAIFQPLAGAKLMFLAGARGVTGGGEAAPDDPAALDVNQLWRENEELKRLLTHQALQLDTLEQQLRTATRIHDLLKDPQARLIIAAVVAYDATPTQETIEIARGSRAGVRLDDWVAAGAPEADAAPEAGGAAATPKLTGYQLLLRQALIGRVVEVFPFTARVRLTTDPAFGPIRTRVAKRLDDGSVRPHDERPLLYGSGSGRMEIREAKLNFAKLSFTLVLTDAGGGSGLGLLLGTVEGSRSVAGSPLHHDLDVRPLVDARSLSRVYVISRPATPP